MAKTLAQLQAEIEALKTQAKIDQEAYRKKIDELKADALLLKDSVKAEIDAAKEDARLKVKAAKDEANESIDILKEEIKSLNKNKIKKLKRVFKCSIK